MSSTREDKRSRARSLHAEGAEVDTLGRQLAEAESALEALLAGQGAADPDALRDLPDLLRQARQALSESNARYRRVVTESPAILFEMAADGTIVFVNRAVQAITGYQPAELIGQNWRSLFQPVGADSERLIADLTKRLQSADAAGYEVTLAGKDGSPFTLELDLHRHQANGTLARVMGYGVDRTRRKQYEEEKSQLAQELGERIQELTLLHRVARLLQDNGRPLPEVLADLVALLPGGWRYPDILTACILIDGAKYATPDFASTPWMLRAEFTTAGGASGVVEVCYREERPGAGQSPFSPEEQNLLDSIAEMLEAYLDRVQAEAKLLQAKDELEMRVEERTRQLSTAMEELEVSNEELRVTSEELQRQNSLLAALQASEHARAAELETVLQAAPAIVWIAHDPEGRRITGNRASYELLRLPWGSNASKTAPEGEQPANFRVLKDGVELDPEELPVQLAARGMEVRDFEEDVVFDDGTIRHLIGNASPLRDEDGRVRGAVAAFVDITERKRAEETLRLSEERFRSVLENSLDAAYRRNLQTDRYDYLSPVFERITGWSVQEMNEADTETVLGRIHPDDRAGTEQEIERTLAASRAAGQASGTLEYRYMTKGGQYVWLGDRITVLTDDEGRPLYRLGIVRDVTERREMEQALRAARDELATLLHVSNSITSTLEMEPLLGLILDQLKTVIDYDGATLYELEGDELVERAYRGPSAESGANLERLRFSLREAPAHRQVVESREAVILSEVSDSWSFFFRGEAGERVADQGREVLFGSTRSWIGVPLRVRDRVLGMLGLDGSRAGAYTARDAELALAFANQAAIAVENARLYQQAQELSAIEERQRLARDLHDAVSQSLFSASMIADVLPRLWERNPDQGRLRLQELQRLTRGAQAEMRTLLLELRPAGLVERPLGELMRQLGTAVTGRARLPVDVQVEGDGCLLPDVQVVLYRIAQEALNNVVKHSQATQAGIELRCQSSEAGEPEGVELLVWDNGRGLPQESFSADHMGLRIMRERAEAIGAQLSIESRPGQGTQVRVRWARSSTQSTGQA